MALGYTAHASPMQMVFYSGGSYPAEYAGDAFVTMRGSWNRKPASGYEIVRIKFDKGVPQSFEPFVSGFLTEGGQTHIARPVGLIVAHDGSLLMSDDANGTIYRIAHARSATATPATKPPADQMQAQAAKGIGVPLAKDRPETKANQQLKVAFPTIAPGAEIPVIHSEYADGVSPALSWSPVEGAKSYVVIMEDPDAKPITPFVHWLAWNIPGNATYLPEGLQEHMRLTEPDGLMQGVTSRGSVGYFGPQPPAGDPPHRYHFQLFALDTVLAIPPGSDREVLLKAMAGRVISKGSVAGQFQQTVKPLK